jgi:chemotaxis-related protein WspD
MNCQQAKPLIDAYADGELEAAAILELEQHIHCRNCPVYSAGAADLLEGDPPADYLTERTTHFAQPVHIVGVQRRSVVIFRVGAEWLALPTSVVTEIANLQPIHSLPHRRNGIVLGLANVRGELVICISVGHLLQVERIGPLESLRTNYRRLLVVNWDATRLAFPVDEVHGPQRFHPQDLQSTPSTVARSNPRYAQGILHWQNHTVGLLDADLLLSNLNSCLA